MTRTSLFPSCRRWRRPTYCANVPFHAIGIVKNNVSSRASSTFTDISTCSDDQAVIAICDVQCSGGDLAILRRHAAAKDDKISHEWREPLLKVIEMVLSLRQNNGRTLCLKRFQHVIEDEIIPP